MDYRREIDGLRALAVIPVILFHAGFTLFSGGYIGVDIFFVISGYLITSIITNDISDGKFSISTFYERRARRILPALFFIIVTCLPFAWIWLLPDDFRRFSDSIISVVFFISNHLFSNQSGYFDTAAEFKPLLHTWSLAVEEQYYVLFPLLLASLWKFGRRSVASVLFLLLLSSLFIAHWASSVKPAAAFYLLPTRAWELLLGGLVALYLANKPPKHTNRLIAEAASFSGILLILYGIFFFDKNTQFPSLYTISPTIGTALIIIFATPKNFTGKFLGNPLFVGIGLISYSAYLWHQPIFAFARHRSLEAPTPPLLAALSLLSLALAYLSWKYIEQPFRDKFRFSRRTIFQLSIAGSSVLLCFGLVGHLSKGFPNRISGERAEFLNYFENSSPDWRNYIYTEYREDCNFYDIKKFRNGNATQIPIANIANDCHKRDGRYQHAVFLWGDSHAQQLHPGLKQILPKEWQILQVASSACEAKIELTSNRLDYCIHSNWFAYSSIKITKPDVVVVAQNLNHNPNIMQSIGNHLLSIGVKKVIFTGPTPHWINDLPKLVIKQWDNIPRRTTVGLDSKTISLDDWNMKQFQHTSSLRYLSIMDNFCNKMGCLIYIGDDVKSGLTSWDYGHLTPIASIDFAKNKLVPEILK